MLATRLLAILLLPVLLIPAASRKPPSSARGENEDLILNVTLHIDPADVKELIGNDLDGHYIVAEIKIDPKYGKDLVIDRDDFVLRTAKDGEKAKPFTGSQIAGQTALVVSEDGGEVKQQRSKWGLGGPVMIGGGGAAANDKAPPKTTMKNEEQENPLKKVLDAKILQEGKTTDAVHGLLYFPMEKQKMKDLEILFGGKENRITLNFK